MAKLESNYYYHLTNPNTLKFLRSGGFTSSAYRTGGDLRAAKTGAFHLNKTAQFGQKLAEKELLIIDFILDNLDIESHALNNDLDYTVSYVLSTMVRKYHDLENLLDKSMWGKYFRDGALTHHNSFYARCEIDLALKSKLREIFNNKPVVAKPIKTIGNVNKNMTKQPVVAKPIKTIGNVNKNMTKQQKIIYRKKLKDAIREVNNEMITTLANLYTQLWYDAEEIICATHCYFFNLNGILDNIETYTKHLESDQCILLRVNTECAPFFFDDSQADALITTTPIPPTNIEIAYISFGPLNRIMKELRSLRGSEALGVATKLNVDIDGVGAPSIYKSSFLKFSKSFRPLLR